MQIIKEWGTVLRSPCVLQNVLVSVDDAGM